MTSRRGRAGATVLLGVVALAGCTPGPVAPTPAPVPPVSQSPTETPQERQERLDYAAAEKSYRAFRAEFNRVLRKGGSEKPTVRLRQTAGGSYLTQTAEVLAAYKGLQNRQVGDERIGFVRLAGYTAKVLSLEVCEDTSKVRTVDRSGKVVGKGELLTVSLEARRVGDVWKLWSGSAKEVPSCD